MGKASRLKNQSRRPSIPGLRDSPYSDAFTTAEWDEARARAERLGRFFRDAVKVTDGTIIGIDEATLQFLMLHFALAGGTQSDDLALIRPKVLPDETGRLEDAVEWVVKRFDTPEARQQDAEEEARRHKAALDVHMAQMTPEAREAFRRDFEPAARKAFEAGGRQSTRDLYSAASEETPEAKYLREQAQRMHQEGQL